jgi:hypothetical protein
MGGASGRAFVQSTSFRPFNARFRRIFPTHRIRFHSLPFRQSLNFTHACVPRVLRLWLNSDIENAAPTAAFGLPGAANPHPFAEKKIFERFLPLCGHWFRHRSPTPASWLWQ